MARTVCVSTVTIQAEEDSCEREYNIHDPEVTFIDYLMTDESE
jgi:hypothetical protein